MPVVFLIILGIPLLSLAWWIWADRRLYKLGAGSAMFRYWSGLYQNNSRAVVVSNGTGNWFPVRMNAPAEIIHLTLRRA